MANADSMEKIASFQVDHLVLNPGIYLSRTDLVGDTKILTYDLRIMKPNAEPVMNTAEMHTIEHLAATFLRNHEQKDNIIYFGPMGCRTGFYLIIQDKLSPKETYNLIKDCFEFISEFDGEIPGATAKDCGNYLDNNLPMAKYIGDRYLKTLEGINDYSFEYAKPNIG